MAVRQVRSRSSLIVGFVTVGGVTMMLAQTLLAQPDDSKKTVITSAEKVVTLKVVTPPPQPTGKCQASMDFSFFQRNTMATVEATINNKDCAASSGEYLLTVGVRDASGEVNTLEFTGNWQRKDDKSISLKTDYPIGDNVDLTRVRVRRITCACAEVAAP